MMKITTIEEHQAAIDHHQREQERRLDLDVSDCALSSWAAGNSIRAHGEAIRALKLGAANGIDGPAVQVLRLKNVETGEIYRRDQAERCQTKFGFAWRVRDPELQKKIGKTGDTVWATDNDKTLAKNGLEKVTQIVPATRWLQGDGAGIGMPSWYRAIEKEKN